MSPRLRHHVSAGMLRRLTTCPFSAVIRSGTLAPGDWSAFYENDA